MPIIFSGQPGRVVAIQDPAVAASSSGPLSVEGWSGFQGFRSIITRCMLSSACNAQFLHTLGGDIYVYTFGDRIGQFAVSGLAFSNSCAGSGGPGIGSVLQYYNNNRVAKRESPLTTSP